MGPGALFIGAGLFLVGLVMGFGLRDHLAVWLSDLLTLGEPR